MKTMSACSLGELKSLASVLGSSSSISGFFSLSPLLAQVPSHHVVCNL